MDYYNNQDELYHYGRKGMKWGQNIFGKVKSGASRVGKKISDARQKKKEAKAAERLRKKPLSELTDAELKQRIERLKLEQSASQMMKNIDPNSGNASEGKKFISKFMSKSVGEAIIDASKSAFTEFAKKKLFKALGLSDEAADELKDLKSEYDKLDVMGKIKDAKKKLSDEPDDDAKLKKTVERMELEVREKNARKSLEVDEEVAQRKREAELGRADAAIYAGKTAKAKYDKDYGTSTDSSDSKPATDNSPDEKPSSDRTIYNIGGKTYSLRTDTGYSKAVRKVSERRKNESERESREEDYLRSFMSEETRNTTMTEAAKSTKKRNARQRNIAKVQEEKRKRSGSK